MDQRFGTPKVDSHGAEPAASPDAMAADGVVPELKHPPSVLVTILVGLVAPIVTGIVAAILILAVAACLPGAPRTRELMTWALRSAPGLAALMLLQNGLLALWAWRLAKRRTLPPTAWLRLRPVRLDATSWVLLLILAGGVFGLSALASWWARELGLPADQRPVDRLVETMRAAPGISWLVLVLAMGIGPGFGEEMWVRGHILRALEQRYRARAAVLGSAVIFALLHLDPAHMVFALPFGLVFGWLTIRTNSILPGIVCHAFVNSGVNLARAIEVRRPDDMSEIQPMTVTSTEVIGLLGLTAAGVIAALLLERRFRQATSDEAAPGEAPVSEERP